MSTTRSKIPPLLYTFYILDLLLYCHIAAGATYYVDNSGSPACANRPSNGRESAPWCTVAYGVGRLTGGDTLYVKNGTYNEAINIFGPAGTSSAHTIISAYPEHRPILRGTGLSGGRMRIANTSYMDFVGFTITNYNQGLYIDGHNSTLPGPDHILIKNVTVHDVGQEGIAIRDNASFITLDQVTVYNTGGNGPRTNGEGIYIGGGTAPDNTHHVTIHNSTIHDTQDEGIELKHGTHDVTLDGNIMYRALSPGSHFSNGGGAIEINHPDGLYGANPNHLVRNNVIHDISLTSGITKRGIRIATGATVYNNVLYDIETSYIAIFSNQADYPRFVYHNTIDAPSSTAVVNSDTDLDIKNNIGPDLPHNIATSDAYYEDKAAANYRVTSGTAPINAGTDLTDIVPVDIEGTSRIVNSPPDLGAYETADTGIASQDRSGNTQEAVGGTHVSF